MIKQIVNVHHKNFATGLFWQPLGVGNTAQNYARQLSKTNDKRYTLYIEYKSMLGVTDERSGARVGMPSAAVEIVNSLSDLISFLGVFRADKHYYLVAVRNGVIIRDILFDNAEEARQLYTQLAEIPDWGALFAPTAWGMPKSQEKFLADLIGKKITAKLRQISVLKSMAPSILFTAVFVIFGLVVLTNPVNQNPDKKSKINPEIAKEYRRKIEMKKQEILERKIAEEVDQVIEYPYDRLPDVMERAQLCYKAIAFVMQPLAGWNQTYAKCDGDFVSVTFSRDFGTLNDFYEIGADLMPGALVQEISEDEVMVRVNLPELKTGSSVDERDQVTVMRDVATLFQQVNTKADIKGVTDKMLHNNKTHDIYVTEVGVTSKLIPTEFMQAFKDFDGVYMSSVSWRANTRNWNYEVIIYSK
ncbi:MAG: type 4b pilus protein PilO2 [Alphaproteobacteria bacterium]|nr:type 4b pilus protein PilO2 [Alphaproteobacteria bacterium]